MTEDQKVAISGEQSDDQLMGECIELDRPSRQSQRKKHAGSEKWKGTGSDGVPTNPNPEPAGHGLAQPGIGLGHAAEAAGLRESRSDAQERARRNPAGARKGEGDPGGGPAGSGRSPPQSIQKEAGAG